MRDVYSTVYPPHAVIVRLALNDAGIKFFIPNENAAAWYSDVGSPAAPVIFQVPEEDFTAAERVIHEALDRIREMPERKPSRKKEG